MGKVVDVDYETALKQKLEMIPKMDFVENVDAFMKLSENGENVPATLRRTEELYHRVKFLESNNISTKQK